MIDEIAQLEKDLVALKSEASTGGDSALFHMQALNLGTVSPAQTYMWDLIVEPTKNPSSAYYRIITPGVITKAEYYAPPNTSSTIPDGSWPWSMRYDVVLYGNDVNHVRIISNGYAFNTGTIIANGTPSLYIYSNVPYIVKSFQRV